MFARCGKILVITALVLTTGAHWAALQTVAWTTMLAKNLQTDSFSEAVSKTFDGEHPCCMCKAIASGKMAEKEAEVIAPVLKMEFPPCEETLTFFPPGRFELLPQSNTFAELTGAKPPVPPPRSFFV